MKRTGRPALDLDLLMQVYEFEERVAILMESNGWPEWKAFQEAKKQMREQAEAQRELFGD